MDSKKITALLGFASKAGKLSYGADTALKSVKEKKAKLIVIANDVSDKSRKEAEFFAGKGNIRTLVLGELDIAAVSAAVGRRCGILSVNDSGFADAVLKA
ncbi:MAG: ribosomal L7Ae/L30e/S12e/Gadd45 family protein [Acutalibacteraceae bacterium]|nr:ribosomal L7Ae/L30e/S12e/Gadd45 family protein [Clostridia bacterium]MEE1330811.1 ribosomal L7Ae/L30e/S12e/Gadd45 family protein [Acutalibacteraceae bacterium]